MNIEPNNINDRLNLVLLENLKKRTWLENRKLKKLKTLYFDNDTYHIELSNKLELLGFIKTSYEKPRLNSNGNPTLDNTSYLHTTEKGKKALKQASFPSEFSKQFTNKTFRNLELIAIFLAALGGLTTFLPFLYKNIKHLIYYIFCI